MTTLLRFQQMSSLASVVGFETDSPGLAFPLARRACQVPAKPGHGSFWTQFAIELTQSGSSLPGPCLTLKAVYRRRTSGHSGHSFSHGRRKLEARGRFQARLFQVGSRGSISCQFHASPSRPSTFSDTKKYTSLIWCVCDSGTPVQFSQELVDSLQASSEVTAQTYPHPRQISA